MSSPTISVIMPVYNAERYVAIAVESILNQTYFDFEFIIINDGSSDQSLSILQKYAKEDNRIRLVTRENRGLVFTLNEMIEIAKGKIIARMDADDISLPNRLNTQYDFMLNNQHILASGCNSELIDEFGYKIGTHILPNEHQEIDYNNLRGRCSICHPSAVMRSKYLKNIGGYNRYARNAEDLDLWLRLAEAGRLANISDILLKYRVHFASESAIHNVNQKNTAINVCNIAWKRRGIEACVIDPSVAWRSGSDRDAQLSFALQNGWAAWKRKHREAWWNYTKKAILLNPFSISSWKLLIFGHLKSPP